MGQTQPHLDLSIPIGILTDDLDGRHDQWRDCEGVGSHDGPVAEDGSVLLPLAVVGEHLLHPVEKGLVQFYVGKVDEGLEAAGSLLTDFYL